jgi:hypothetical protein
MCEGSDRAIFPESVIFIQQFQLVMAKNAQTAQRRKPSIASRKRYILSSKSPPPDLRRTAVVKLIKLYRRLMNTYKAMA